MRYRNLLIFSALTLAVACGGGPSRPQPLKTTVDDMYLASVSLDEKQGVLKAQNDFAAAKMEYANAKNKQQEARKEIKVAKNELKAAKLDRSSAKHQQQDAKRKASTAEMKSADRQLKIADAKVDAAKQKIGAWKQYKKAYKKKSFWAEEQMYAAEARYELAKARLAKQKGISPPGFDFAKFEKQAKDRSRRAQKRKVGADKALAKAKRTWEKYKSSEAKAAKA
ncbi:MAG: hypothetical protein KJO07_24850, partial [Deltaproteobacteria bacterium]|nr:hypothetical protein [Deltaproteobacteria bacterium]